MDLSWIGLTSRGGVAALDKKNNEKAKLVYDLIDLHQFYTSPVKKEDRSNMNVVFRIHENNEELEEKFVSEAKKKGLEGLKGHRLVGGLRASLYNAQPLEGVSALVAFMKDFEKKYG